MLDRKLRMALLFDAYGKLLTEKQRTCFTLYHHEDLSLGEIAASYGISRQAVYDILRRSEKALVEFEGRLGLVRRSQETALLVEQMMAAVARIGEATASLPPDRLAAVQAALAVLNDGLATM